MKGSCSSQLSEINKYLSFFLLGFILLFIVSVAAGNKVQNQLPELGEYCVISEDLFWRSEALLNPNQYYYCVNRRVVLGTCPVNTGFLKTGDEECTNFTTWKCLRPIIYDLTCENSTNGSIVPIPNPNKYGYCVDGKPSSFHNCPKALGFIHRHDFLGCTTWNNWNKYTECF